MKAHVHQQSANKSSGRSFFKFSHLQQTLKLRSFIPLSTFIKAIAQDHCTCFYTVRNVWCETCNVLWMYSLWLSLCELPPGLVVTVNENWFSLFLSLFFFINKKNSCTIVTYSLYSIKSQFYYISNTNKLLKNVRKCRMIIEISKEI